MPAWYEVQRLVNRVPGESDGEWVMWEQSYYTPKTIDDGKPRNEARRKAFAAAKECVERTGSPVRVIFVQLSKEFGNAA